MDSFQFQHYPDPSNLTTIKTDIFVFVDTNWPYNWVVDYVAYVLQHLNIHPFGSRVTLFAAADAALIVNTTDYIINVYQQWNATTHNWHAPGFNLPIILNTLTTHVEDLLQLERSTDNLGGRSLIALLVPSPTSFVDEQQYNYCLSYMERLRQRLPNLHFIYYGGGALVRFHDFVREPSRDLLFLNTMKPPEQCGAPVVRRLRQVPRRIWNPRCSSNGVIVNYGMNSLVQYARLGSINFYRLDSLYFPYRGSMRYLKITAISQLTFQVCFSRSIELPHRNASSELRPGESCESAAPSAAFSYDLTDACFDSDFNPCPPLFFSVQAQSSGAVSCTEPACQTPDEAQYGISLNNLGCSGGSILNFSKALLSISLICLYVKFKC